ncbi:caspase family protein [candidate division KSB1 bacterium]|nr:caspase family protein [candidate division KSB1 bacterium]
MHYQAIIRRILSHLNGRRLSFLIVAFFTSIPFVFADEWYKNYEKALKFIEKKEWENALKYLNDAIEIKPKPEFNANPGELIFLDYLPYLYRAKAYYHLNKIDEADEDLIKSEEAGEAVQAKRDNAAKKEFTKYRQLVTDALNARQFHIDTTKGGDYSFKEMFRKWTRNSESWAVVIGINNYTIEKNGYKRLNYAKRDADEVRQYLISALNFSSEKIYYFPNDKATKRAIDYCLGDLLRNKLKPDDRLIVYFSGHGETISTANGEKHGYLIPVDGKKDSLNATCIPMSQISLYSDLIPARQVLFIIDACFSGIAGIVNKGIDKVTEKQIEKFIQSRGRQILTAGSADEPAQMGEQWNKHSVFTYHLLIGLTGEADYDKNKVISANELAMYVATNVSTDTDYKQNPQLYNLGKTEGNFIFYRKGDF